MSPISKVCYNMRSTFLIFYAAQNGCFLPTDWDNLPVSSTRVNCLIEKKLPIYAA